MNNLSIVKDENGITIKLDDNKIDCVKKYQLKSSANGLTELMLILDVTLV